MVREPPSLRQEVHGSPRHVTAVGVNLILPPRPTASCSNGNFACALTVPFRLSLDQGLLPDDSELRYH